MSGCEFAPDAVQDLNDIHDYIAQDSPSAAERWVLMVEERCETLGENPMMGRARPELLSGLRSFPAGNYTICYIPIDDGVEVLRVIHSARDVTALF